MLLLMEQGKGGSGGVEAAQALRLSDTLLPTCTLDKRTESDMQIFLD
jgi:hypothetical protein